MSAEQQETLSSPKNHSGSHFEDGKRIVDYVLVFQRENVAEPATTYINTYLQTLSGMGLDLETYQGSNSNDLFVLIHIPEPMIKLYAAAYDMEPQKRTNLRLACTPLWSCPTSQALARKNDEFTNANRIILINKILESTKYGEQPEEYGLSKLMREKIIKDAFPLHEDISTSSEDPSQLEPNDRQQLLATWANFRNWYKEAPLDLVQRYFGSEIALSFALSDSLNQMLMPAAVVGTSVFVSSSVSGLVRREGAVEEVCEEDGFILCPTCEFYKNCKYRDLSDYCLYSKWNNILDNYLTVVYAILMSFWATIFLKYWKRKETGLKLRWNVHSDESLNEVRQKFAERTKRRRTNRYGDFLEPYVPTYVKLLYVTCTVSACILLIFIIIIAVFAIVAYKLNISQLLNMEYDNYLTLISSCILQVVVVSMFEKTFQKLAIWLTDLENPRTQNDYDSSVLHKRYLLSFANNYAVLFYIAFIKGHLFKKPGDKVFHTIVERDTCQPFGCVVALCVQLVFLVVLRNIAGNVLILLFRRIKKCFKKRFRRNRDNSYVPNDTPLFEKEYKLQPMDRYLVMSRFCDMIIEYGFLTFFAIASPLAPLIALANNIIEHRFEAINLVRKFRRPLPKTVGSIGNWDGILRGITHLSAVTNAFVTAFTSDFIGREVYRYRFSSLSGYINSTLSAFATKEYYTYAQMSPRPDICYYRGKRLPPEDPNRFTLTEDYWRDLTWRLVFVLVFEHLVIGFGGVLTYSVSDMPTSMHKQLDMDRKLVKSSKIKTQNEEAKRGDKQGRGNVNFERGQFYPKLNRKEFGNIEPLTVY